MSSAHHSAGRHPSGARPGQGRTASTAPKARTLEAAAFSAAYHHEQNDTVDIAHLKRAVTLAMALSRYGILADLKRVGSQLAGCCPIHDGSDPRQFVVHLASSNWFCFGRCNRGGGMLDFVALKERVPIARAAQLVAEWFTINPRSISQRQQRRTRMSSKPSHKVYVVEDRENPEPGDEQSGFWTRIGSAWPHKDGRGLNVVLSALPVGNRMVLREFTEEDPAVTASQSKAKAKK